MGFKHSIGVAILKTRVHCLDRFQWSAILTYNWLCNELPWPAQILTGGGNGMVEQSRAVGMQSKIAGVL